MSIKKKILHSFFLICAVICLSFGLSACGGDGEKPWMAASVGGTLPVGVEKVNFDASKDNQSGTEQGQDLKFNVELGVGYGLGTVKVFANGAEVTQKTLLETESKYQETWEYTIPKVESDVVLTFSGDAEKKNFDVKFTLVNDSSDGDDLSFNFAGKENMTTGELREMLSQPVSCKHQEDIVFEAISPKGFLESAGSFASLPKTYRKENDKFIVATTINVDITREYEISLGEAYVIEEYNEEMSGFYVGSIKDISGSLTLTNSGEAQVNKFEDMTEDMTLSITNVSGLVKEVYEYLKENDDSEIYFDINGLKIDINKIELDNENLKILDVGPVWQYSLDSADAGTRYAYRVSIHALDRYFSLNADKWMRVQTESGGRFVMDALNYVIINQLINTASPYTSIRYAGQQEYLFDGAYYYAVEEFGVEIKIDPFLDEETEKTYTFTLCGKSVVIKYTKTDDNVSAVQINCDDGLTAEISAADENGVVGVTLKISGLAAWSGFSIELAD